MEKTLYLLRGLPGSGKSTAAKSIGGIHLEADMYFMKNGDYIFDASKLKMAHNWCATEAQKAMVKGESLIVVSNTFTQEWEMSVYFDLASQNGYKVFTMIVENRHGGNNQHGVPEESLNKMLKRFDIKLI